MKAAIITGCVALSVLSASAAHAIVLPDEMMGKWCFIKKQEPHTIFERPQEKDCANREGGGQVFQDSVEDARQKCKFDKIEQISPTVYQVHAICEYDGGVKGWNLELKLEDNRLIMDVLTEG